MQKKPSREDSSPFSFVRRFLNSPKTKSRTERRGTLHMLDVLEDRTVPTVPHLPTLPIDSEEGYQSATVIPAPAFTTKTSYTGTQFVQGTDPRDIALQFLRNQVGSYAASTDLSNLLVTNDYASSVSGVTNVYIRQSVNGLPINGADMDVHVDRFGNVITAGGGYVRDVFGNAEGINPSITASEAIQTAAAQLGLTVTTTPTLKTNIGGISRQAVYSGAGVSLDDIPAELYYVMTSPTHVELAWHITMRTPDGNHWYDLGVDGQTGQVLFADNWIDSAGSYQALKLPIDAPNDGARTLEVNPENALASPFGWHDTNGVAGPEYTITRGNNVYASEDMDANDSPGFSPDGGAGLVFNFPFDDVNQTPDQYLPASITNLFYTNNILHDIHYQYGFDEAAGNFQFNTYGRGGTGNDPVQADALDGSGTNNANFGTPPDGTAPRMQMYRWNRASTPNGRDSDLDNGIITHEYGHGVSNRLTGGAANSSALSALQSGGMGEGWSDFWAVMFTMRPTDTPNTPIGMGTYSIGQSNTGAGIRTYPYTYNMAVNPHTFNDYNGNQEVHYGGEIWATTLLDMNWLFVNKYGYDPNLYAGSSGTAGNQRVLTLVMEALKLQPANPSFLDARDAILLADQVLYNGADGLEIWTAFARRGMGFSAIDVNANSRVVTAAFDLPAVSTGVAALTGGNFTGAKFAVGDTIGLEVRDSDIAGVGNLSVVVTSSSGDSETVFLTEIGSELSFVSSIPTSGGATNINDGILQMHVGDTITMTYLDASPNGLRTDTAIVIGPYVVFNSPSSGEIDPVDHLDFVFNQAMNQGTFSVAQDVKSFTGYNGLDLLSQITGSSWLDAKTLRVNFNPMVLDGTFTMTIGPNINSVSDGSAMDQDNDGVPGEALADPYVGTFTIDQYLGPDGFGYVAGRTAFTNIDLVPGAPGVNTVNFGSSRDNKDDGTAAINLGSNTFNFYGVSFTGNNQLYVSPNGLITFSGAPNQGEGNYFNSDLRTFPSQRAIAVMWDDWTTEYDANDQVLYQFIDTNADSTVDSLVIEWNQVYVAGGSASTVTFQAILRLNTGAAAGDFVLNYLDLDAGGDHSNAGSSTVGIKDTGDQSAANANRILVIMNNQTSPFIGSGKAIKFTTKNDTAPNLVFLGGTATYVENSTPVIIDAASTVGDPDSANFNTGALTISITGNATVADILSIRNQGTSNGQIGVTGNNVTYNSGSGAVTIGTFAGGNNGVTPLVITFNGNSNSTAVTALLRNLQFSNTSDAPSTLARTIRYVMTDGDGGTSTPVTRTVNISAVNDAPVNTLPGGPLVAIENTPYNVNNLSIADVDAGTSIISVVLSVAHGTIFVNTSVAGGLNAGQVTSNATGSVTVTGTIAQINTTFGAASGVIYTGALGYVGADSFQVTSDDLGNTGSGGSLSDTDSVAILLVNGSGAPVVGVASGPIDFTENGAPVLLDSNATVADLDNANFDGGSLTISIASNANAADVLSIHNEGIGAGQIFAFNSVVSYGNVQIGTVNGGSGGIPLVITLNANATVPATQALLRNINFTNNSDDPGATTRNIVVVLHDGGGGFSTPTNTTINVHAVNDAPVNTVPAPLLGQEDTPVAVTGLSIADVDAAGGLMSVTLTATNGTLNVRTDVPGGITIGDISSNGSGSVQISATIAQINTTFADASGVTYTGNLNFTGLDSVSMVVNDGGNTGSGGALQDTDSFNITLSQVNDPPVNIVPGAQNGTEDSPIVFSTTNGNAILVSDPDAGTTGVVRVTISVNNGTLTLAGTGGLTFFNGDGFNDNSMTFSGSINAINAALNGLAFTPTAEFSGSSTLTINTNDLGLSGVGGALIDIDTVAIDIANVNDAPILQLTTQTIGYVEDSGPIRFDAIGLISDVDASDFDTGTLTATIVSNGTSSDFLGIRDQGTGAGQIGVSGNNITYGGVVIGTFTGGNGSTPLVMTFNANSNAAAAQALLQNLTFINTSNLPTPGARVVTFQMTDGDGGTSLTSSITVTIDQVNDLPVNSVPVSTTTVDGNVQVKFGGMGVSDADALTANLQVTFTASHGIVTILTNVAGGITANQVTGNGTDTLVILAPQAAINATLSVAGSLLFQGVGNFDFGGSLTMVTNDLGNSGLGGPRTDTDVITINDAPINTNLEITGTAQNDAITVRPYGQSTTDVTIEMNGVNLGRFRPTAQTPMQFDLLAGNDTLVAGADVLVGMNVKGGDGDDLFVGGSGADTFHGGDGNDLAFGIGGNDIMFGEGGNDSMDGGDGNDSMDGGDAADLIFGSAGVDLIFGGAGNDAMDGGSENDSIQGDVGNDLLFGGSGNDQLFAQDGDDSMDGNAGDDKIDGGAGNDLLFGSDGDDQLFGLDGNDSMDGNAGNDFMDGGAGDDVMFGSDGNDQLFGGAGFDNIDGGRGNDSIDGGTENDVMFGSAGDDKIYGQDGNDSMDGNAGNDYLDGGAGDDLMFGSANSDSLFGGAGNDAMDGGSGSDIADGGLGSNQMFNIP